MILNKIIRFISLPKTRYISCTHIQFYTFRKHPARFATPLTAQDTGKLTEKDRNTGRCTTHSSGKGVCS